MGKLGLLLVVSGALVVALALVFAREGRVPVRATGAPLATRADAQSAATDAAGAVERKAGEPLGRTVATARMHGRVLDPRDGSPVPGCDLYRREGALGLHLGTTDDAGSFAFEPRDADPLVLKLRTPPQWDPVVTELTLDESQRSGERPILLHALRAAASPVFGVVRSAGAPQPGLRLSVRDGYAMEDVRTDDEGRFATLQEFRHGEIRVRSSELKWARVAEPKLQHTRRIDEERPLAVEVLLGPLYRLDVTRPEAAPRLRLVASLRTTKVPEFAAPAWFQSVRVSVPPGNPVSVRFPLRSRATATLRLELRDESGAWVGVGAVPSTGSTDPVSVALARAASLSGVVRGPDQEPLESIGVFLAEGIPVFTPKGEPQAAGIDHRLASEVVYSDADGRWSLPSVAPGRYLVIAVDKPKSSASPSVQFLELAPGASRRIEVAFDPRRRPARGALSGRLVAPGPARPAKVSVVRLQRVLMNRDDPLEVWQTRERDVHTTVAPLQRDGAAWSADFAFEDVPAGTYSLSADAGWFEVQPEAALVVAPSGGHELLVRNDVPVRTLVVHVSDVDTGEPVPKPKVLVGERSFKGINGVVTANDVPEAVLDDVAVGAEGYRSRTYQREDLRLEADRLVLDAALELDGQTRRQLGGTTLRGVTFIDSSD